MHDAIIYDDDFTDSKDDGDPINDLMINGCIKLFQTDLDGTAFPRA